VLTGGHTRHLAAPLAVRNVACLAWLAASLELAPGARVAEGKLAVLGNNPTERTLATTATSTSGRSPAWCRACRGTTSGGVRVDLLGRQTDRILGSHASPHSGRAQWGLDPGRPGERVHRDASLLGEARPHARQVDRAGGVVTASRHEAVAAGDQRTGRGWRARPRDAQGVAVVGNCVDGGLGQADDRRDRDSRLAAAADHDQLARVGGQVGGQVRGAGELGVVRSLGQHCAGSLDPQAVDAACRRRSQVHDTPSFDVTHSPGSGHSPEVQVQSLPSSRARTTTPFTSTVTFIASSGLEPHPKAAPHPSRALVIVTHEGEKKIARAIGAGVSSRRSLFKNAQCAD
jgi:hypothetical protein